MSTKTRRAKFADVKVGDEVAMKFDDGCLRVGTVTGVWPEHNIFEASYVYILGGKHIEKGSFSLKSGRYDKRGRYFTSGRVTSSEPDKVQACRDWCDAMLLRTAIENVDWRQSSLSQLRRIRAILEETPDRDD